MNARLAQLGPVPRTDAQKNGREDVTPEFHIAAPNCCASKKGARLEERVQ
jgi:hypothetical protein